MTEVITNANKKRQTEALEMIACTLADMLDILKPSSETSATKQYGKTVQEWYQEYAQAQNEIKVLQSKLANAETTLQAVQEELQSTEKQLASEVKLVEDIKSALDLPPCRTIFDHISHILRQAEDGIYYGKIHALLNDVALLMPIPGCPEYSECLQWLRDNLPQLQTEARLGRLVRQMPTDYHLLRAKDFWKCGRLDGWKSNGHDTPEEALIAAGIGQSELPETQDFEPDKENCSVFLANSGKAYPRTCKVCGLGPCFFKLQMKTAETQEVIKAVTATEPPAGEKKPERFTCDCVKYFSLLAGEKWLPFKYCHECGGTGVKYQSHTHSDDGLPETQEGCAGASGPIGDRGLRVPERSHSDDGFPLNHITSEAIK